MSFAERPSWDAYFMGLAEHAATRATCPRKAVGCVIVRDKRALATGYNGSLPHSAHCSDAGCDMEDGHCVRTLHAEANAVAAAASAGVQLADWATAYVTACPCWPCLKLLVAAGVRHVVFKESYRVDPRVQEWIRDGFVEPFREGDER